MAAIAVVPLAGGVVFYWPRPAVEAPSAAFPSQAESNPLGVARSDAETASTSAPRARGKSGHPPIMDLRLQMLQHFHGHTRNVFVRSDGFGFGRIGGMARKLFEIPVFSPGELDQEKPVKSPAILEEALAESLARFQSQPGGTKHAGIPFPPGLELRTLDLIGLADKDGPRAYSGGAAFESGLVVSLPQMDREEARRNRQGAEPGEAGKAKSQPETRSLDFFELAGLAELREGKTTFVRHKENIVRMLGALRATEQCLKCHSEASKGDLLGALSYTFVDSRRRLFKEEKNGSGEKPSGPGRGAWRRKR
jgi:hypothetical protein